MTGIGRSFLVNRSRYLAALAGFVVAATATAVSLRVDSEHRSVRGVPQPPAVAPSGPVQVAPTGSTTATQGPIPGTPHPPALNPTRTTPPTGGTTSSPPAPVATTQAPTTQTPTTPAPTATSPDAEEPEDLLKRRDSLPEGVPEQVSFFMGGGSDCFGQESGSPYIAGVAETAEIPTGIVLCFHGFDHQPDGTGFKPLDVTIAAPSGAVTTMTLLPTGNYYATRFPVLPGDPLGKYQVTARQEKLEAGLGFTLTRGSSPRFWLDAPHNEPRLLGTDLDLYLGGFPANRPARFHLYDAQSRLYRTSFTVAVDAIGEAHAVIDTKSDDPPGCYGIISDLTQQPGKEIKYRFCLR
ncbi:hypothetical protein ACIBSW_18615 [Actinoplanes sp. NPDC049668]|uniref:hypothetical protein n=1 Tax=unclassified Actinoplanes TaxID=2626549 RepID=UPI0033B30547